MYGKVVSALGPGAYSVGGSNPGRSGIILFFSFINKCCYHSIDFKYNISNESLLSRFSELVIYPGRNSHRNPIDTHRPNGFYGILWVSIGKVEHGFLWVLGIPMGLSMGFDFWGLSTW